METFALLGAKPKLLDQSSKKAKAIGDSVILSCTFDSSVQFTWLKDGRDLQDSNRIYVSKLKPGVQHLLTIERIQAPDDGVYTCVGKNTDGEAKGEMKLDVILSECPVYFSLNTVQKYQNEGMEVGC